MTTPEIPVMPKTTPSGIGRLKSALLCLPFFLLSALFILSGKHLSDMEKLLPAVLTYLFCNTVFFLMVHTGKTYQYRSYFFVATSFFFIIGFIANLIELRGSMELSQANVLDGETPFCPLVIPMILVPAAFTQTIIFPGSFFSSHASISAAIIMWLGFSLALGRGWCGWVCFFGGIEEGFSKFCKRPRITTIDKKWTYLPYAVLLAIVLLSAITLSPTYCEWLCPFKTVTEFPAVNSIKTAIQALIFVSLFLGLVVTLPILTGRRTQCSLFCPFGAFQTFANTFNIFEVRVDPSRCVHCKLCIKSCPTFSIDEASLAEGKTRLNCTKCGKCIDVCPKQALTYHIKGTPLVVNDRTARLLFLYPAYIFAAAVGGSCLYSGLERIFRLLFTGSMI